ncbi:MAG: hypothetical protein ACXQS8_01805 [Candidatus Helarchaeales archaeon]
MPFVRRGKLAAQTSHQHHVLLDMSDKKNWHFFLKMHELDHVITIFFNYDIKKEILEDLHLAVSVNGMIYCTAPFKKKDLKGFVQFLRSHNIDIIYL